MTSHPLVTVIALCYNHARFVIECLDSIRNQTYPHLQIIIMDDCSRDDSVEIVQEWINRYGIACKFIAHQKNQGLCRTLNEALVHATGKYVAMVACDDAWMPNRIATQITVMETLPDTVGVVYSDAIVMDESGLFLEDSFLTRHCKHPNDPPSGDIFEKLVSANNWIPAMSTLVRRACYDVVGSYDERLVYEDWDMWLRISARFDFHYLPGLIARYRLVSTSMMHTTLIAPDARFHLSSYLICEKMSSLRPGNTLATQTGIHGMCANAERLYKLGHPETASLLRRTAMRSRGWHTRQMAFCASLGISWPVYQRLRSQYAKVKSYLRWRFIPGNRS